MLIDFRTLFPKYNIKPNGVLHVGANVGEEAPVYDELGIKKVIWIEGNPEIFPRLSENISCYPEQKCVCAVISDKQGEPITFHISNNGSQSSSILELGTHLQVHPEVNYVRHLELITQRLDNIFDFGSTSLTLNGYDFLNIDLQGAELKALHGMGDLLNQFKWLYLEVNKEELYKGCALVHELDHFLAASGFERRETMWCGNTGWGDSLYIKKGIVKGLHMPKIINTQEIF